MTTPIGSPALPCRVARRPPPWSKSANRVSRHGGSFVTVARKSGHRLFVNLAARNAGTVRAQDFDVWSDVTAGSGRSIVYGTPGVNAIAVVAVDTAGNKSAPATLTVVF